jgi:hypothetical protein
MDEMPVHKMKFALVNSMVPRGACVECSLRCSITRSASMAVDAQDALRLTLS